MKIAFLGQPTSPPPLPYDGEDSVGIVTYHLARSLAPLAEVTVYARRRPGEPDREWAGEGFVVKRLPFNHRAWGLADAAIAAAGLPTHAAASTLYGRQFATAAARDAAREGIDIIHIMSLAHFAPIVRRAHPRAKIILHFHDDKAHRLSDPRFAASLRAADHVVGCSKFVAGRLRDHWAGSAPTFGVVYDGVDSKQFSPRPADETKSGPTESLYLGRLSPEKGVHVLVDAWPRIHARCPSTILRISGTGAVVPHAARAPLSPPASEADVAAFYGQTLGARFYRRTVGRRDRYYQDRLLDLDAAARSAIVHSPPLPLAELPDRYRSASVFVFPSLWEEAFGMPIIEAMACGVPVVATHGGGVSEIVDEGRTGLLVPRGDPDALAEAVCRLLHDHGFAARLARTAYDDIVPKFSWQRIAVGLLQQYTALATA
ncbi:MAG: glycosyltransferase family 4 protein [Alphaproteobacteria bacterium]|nr:glycosyltransferase family 4 protein [Alphaproteobacteria bacterium]